MPLSDAQKFRAARAILNWSQRDLADYVGVSMQTIHTFENEKRKLHPNNRYACLRAFTDAGITFTDTTIAYEPAPRPPIPLITTAGTITPTTAHKEDITTND